MTEVQHDSVSVLPEGSEADALEQTRPASSSPGAGPASPASPQATALEGASEFDLLEQSLEVPLDEDDDR